MWTVTGAVLQYADAKHDVVMLPLDEIEEQSLTPHYIELDRQGKPTGRASVILEEPNPYDHSELLTLMTLSQFTNNAGYVGRYSTKELALFVGRSERTMRMYICRLVWRKELVRQVNSGEGGVNAYTITPGGYPMSDYVHEIRRKERKS